MEGTSVGSVSVKRKTDKSPEIVRGIDTRIVMDRFTLSDSSLASFAFGEFQVATQVNILGLNLNEIFSTQISCKASVTLRCKIDRFYTVV